MVSAFHVLGYLLNSGEAIVKLRFGVSVLVCAVLVLLSASNSKASSYGDGCTGAIVATGAPLAGVIGVSIYLVHRSHTSMTGCLLRSGEGYSLTVGGKIVQLLDVPPGLKDHHQVQLRGHRSKSGPERVFRVDRVAHDYGDCQ